MKKRKPKNLGPKTAKQRDKKVNIRQGLKWIQNTKRKKDITKNKKVFKIGTIANIFRDKKIFYFLK